MEYTVGWRGKRWQGRSRRSGRRPSARGRASTGSNRPSTGSLEDDRQAPRKQRHTAQRIYQRIKKELPEQSVSASSVWRYVARKKRELGLKGLEAFVLQKAQVDWFEAPASAARKRSLSRRSLTQS